MQLDFSKWYPIASTTDLPKRHVFHAQLLGREFAVWRADDGHVNVWENRCLHRGVRLSIGINEGSELKCQYHGWRYANRTAGCTYIPAHPADAPANTICNKTYECREKYGLIWTCEKPTNKFIKLKDLHELTVLRPIPINSSFEQVLSFLKKDGIYMHKRVIDSNDDFLCFIKRNSHKLFLFIQPQDSNLSVIRGFLNVEISSEKKIDTLWFYNQIFSEIRDKIEVKTINKKPLPAIKPQFEKIPLELANIVDQKSSNFKTPIRVRVADKVQLSEHIVHLKLESIKGFLPTFQPGAHIDISLPNGLIRQYSLTNGPGETNFYSIAVKLESNSTGGSKTIHENVRINDLLSISPPRNNFPLLRNFPKTIFIAGGIGITPLLSMAKTLDSMNLKYSFYFFVQSPNEDAFKTNEQNLKSSFKIFKNLSVKQTLDQIKSLLVQPSKNKNLYVCGPGQMIKKTITFAQENGWNESSIRYEYFKNDNKLDTNSSFIVDLARSAKTLAIPPGKSILEVLRENSINLASSCEQGACGTCKVKVLKGQIHHQDVYLNSEEKKRGDVILTCVSRAKSDRLILDI